MAAKSLHFYSQGLPKDTVLTFVFDLPQSPFPDHTLFPVVWKCVKFVPNEIGHAQTTLHYSNRLGFSLVQVEDNNIVESSGWVEVKRGEVAQIVSKEHDTRFGQMGIIDDPTLIACENNSNGPTNLNLGLVKGDGINQRFEPFYFWDDFRRGSTVITEFTPVLKAYVTGKYEESMVLRGEIEAECVWTQDLNELEDGTGWIVTWNKRTGRYTIRPSEFKPPWTEWFLICLIRSFIQWLIFGLLALVLPPVRYLSDWPHIRARFTRVPAGPGEV